MCELLLYCYRVETLLLQQVNNHNEKEKRSD